MLKTKENENTMTEENYTFNVLSTTIIFIKNLKNSEKTVGFHKDSNFFNSAATNETFHIEKTR